MTQQNKQYLVQTEVFDVSSAGQEIRIDFFTIKHHDRVEKVLLYADVSLGSSTIELEIDKKEVFKKNFPASLIQTTTSLSWKDVAYPVGQKAQRSTVEGKFIDNIEAFSPYKLYLVLLTSKEIR